MYLPSKLKFKFLATAFLFTLLLFLPFQGVIYQIFIFLSQKPFSSSFTSREIDKLKQENLKLQLENKNLKYLQKENEQLRKALDLKSSKEAVLLAAEIIAFVPSSWRRVAIVNRGCQDKVSLGLFAIDEQANLLGKVAEVDKNSCRLMLVDDPEFNVSVFVGEKTFGFLEGALTGARVLYIEEAEEIKLKDKVWLKISSLANPVDIGEVRKASKNENSLFWDISVKLYAKNSFFGKIFLVK